MNKFDCEVEANSEDKKKQPVEEERSTNLEQTRQSDLGVQE